MCVSDVQEKCYQYWPSERSARYQYFVVDPLAEYNMPHYVLREFKVTDARVACLSHSTSSSSSIRLLCFVFFSGRDCFISDSCLAKTCCFRHLAVILRKDMNWMILDGKRRLESTVTFKRITSRIPKVPYLTIFGLHLLPFDLTVTTLTL